ncbi:hypothetical protein CABS01_11237 [Colletotrichum abscissum]|uniref:uncharacterized protein n=1 Tax=Colletotrichum abscissum TaxID=1671311 RepID=UPI0027D4E49C|nr:uncharacterized protein CABS01_11237 [Colletotrichum abscissum]KAK1495009.1 hypothetical protein CABS01_11237 [Colletotrichum abscissum]
MAWCTGPLTPKVPNADYEPTSIRIVHLEESHCPACGIIRLQTISLSMPGDVQWRPSFRIRARWEREVGNWRIQTITLVIGCFGGKLEERQLLWVPQPCLV